MRNLLARRDFRLLFTGLLASMIGDSVMLIVLAIWVKDLTGSNGKAGLTIFFLVAPALVAPLLGWVVDLFRRRPFLIAANLLSAVSLSPLLFVHDAGDVWIIYSVAALYGVSFVVIPAALSGLLKEMLSEDLLVDANGSLQTVRESLRLFGPLLGAGLLTAFGGGTVAILDAATFCIAALFIALVPVREEKPAPPELHLGARSRSVCGTCGTTFCCGPPCWHSAACYWSSASSSRCRSRSWTPSTRRRASSVS
jgi:MFS family permease